MFRKFIKKILLFLNINDEVFFVGRADKLLGPLSNEEECELVKSNM